MTKIILAVLCAFALLLQAESPPKDYQSGTLELIFHPEGASKYVYLIDDEKGAYRYTCSSVTRIHLSEKSKVMFSTEGAILYLIDEDGKKQTTKYLKQQKVN